MAGSTPHAALRLESFEGMDERWSTSSRSCTLLENATWDTRTGWRSAPALATINPYEIPDVVVPWGTPPYGRIRSIAWFSIHDGNRQFLVYENHNELQVFNGSTREYDVLQTGRYVARAPRTRTQYALFGDRLYIVNGVNKPCSFDGWTFRDVGYSVTPNVPTLADPANGIDEYSTVKTIGLGAAAESGGSDEDAVYAYAVSFMDETYNESPLSSTAVATFTNTVAEAGSRHFVGVILPTGPTGTIARNLYRSSNVYPLTELSSYNSFYYCQTINDNVTTFMIDIVPDAGLGSQFLSTDFGPFPAGATLICSHDNRLWCSGIIGDVSVVQYSAPLQPENFPADNRIYVGSDEGGPITAIKSWRGSLIVFKERGIYLIRPRSDGNYAVNQISSSIGCSAPDSAQEIPGVGLAFASKEGIYVLKSGLEESQVTSSIAELTEQIPAVWDRVTKSALVMAHAITDRICGEYVCVVPVDGNQTPSLALVYSWIRNGWSIRTLDMECSVESGDHRGYIYYGSSKASNPGIFTPTEGTAPSAFTIETSWLDFGRLYERVQATGVTLRILGYGKNPANLSYYIDRDLNTLYPAQLQSRESDDPSIKWDRWDQVKLGFATWKTLRPVVQRYSIDARCRELKLKVTCPKKFWILGMEITITSGDTIKVISIDTVTGG